MLKQIGLFTLACLLLVPFFAVALTVGRHEPSPFAAKLAIALAYAGLATALCRIGEKEEV